MQALKVQAQDMLSTFKETMREQKAKSQEKSEVKHADSFHEEALAHEKCQAMIMEAQAKLHQEKAQHRIEAQLNASNIPNAVVEPGYIEYVDRYIDYLESGDFTCQTVGAAPGPIVVMLPKQL